MVRQRWNALGKTSYLSPGKNQVGQRWELRDHITVWCIQLCNFVSISRAPSSLTMGFFFFVLLWKKPLENLCVCCLSLELKDFCGFLGKHQIPLHRMLTVRSCFALNELVKINNVTAVLRTSGEPSAASLVRLLLSYRYLSSSCGNSVTSVWICRLTIGDEYVKADCGKLFLHPVGISSVSLLSDAKF